MSDAKTLTFYLEPDMRKRAETGQINFVNRIKAAFASCGYQCLFKENSEIELLQSANDPGYSLFFMEQPFHPRALTMRLSYFYPFWQIESTAKRWEWAVARAQFRPEAVDGGAAEKFTASWRKRLYGEVTTSKGGYVFIPLQGRLLAKRSFQAASPIEMIEATLANEPDKPVHATLHPKEKYTDKEREALNDLTSRYPQLTVSNADATPLVRECDYIVTQNSGVAMSGYFHEKPAVLFGKVDFHHIAANVSDLGANAAFKRAEQMKPDYSRYLFWFLQEMAINAGRGGAEDKILAAVRARGWDV
ncbi:MAG: hypothetical protein KUG69_00755 [Marinosulfonomonas sp.]|nr:hypothetical protein [Marinosulfonomonas sp.]